MCKPELLASARQKVYSQSQEHLYMQALSGYITGPMDLFSYLNLSLYSDMLWVVWVVEVSHDPG